MRRRITVVGLGLVSALAAPALVSCSSQGAADTQRAARPDEASGGIQLELVPVSGVTLNTVHYAVTSSATPPVIVAEGDLPTPGPSGNFTFGLPLPVGTGYRIDLSADSAELNDKITCGGSFGPFAVTANATSSIQLVLTCHDDASGGVIGSVDVKTDACPKLVFDYLVATPANAYVGQNISVLAKAHDLDGKSVAYTWSTTKGGLTFSPSSGATSSVFSSGSAFGFNIPVTVTANNGECSKSLTTTVAFIISECGDGIIEPGETCDKAIPGSKCPANCYYACGNGVVEAPAEDCEPSNTATCNATCNTRVPVCGDGFVTPPEVCDTAQFFPVPPVGQLCSADCLGFSGFPGYCGDGVVNSAGEECDDAVAPFPGNSSSPTCSSTCKKISTPACVACENAGDCFESVNNCQGVAAPFSAAQQTACYDVMACIEKSNCFDGPGTLGKCYCGSLSTTACSAAPFSGAGSPDGACVNEIKAGFPTFTSNSAVLGGLVATNFPSGAGMKRLSCQKGANSSACLDSCGFTAGGPAFP